MKKLLSLLLLPAIVHAQIDWDNYSTSFQGDGKEGSHPVLVTAIPYNGIYGGATYFSLKPGKLPRMDSLYGADEKRPRYFGASNTIDSGNVYFLAAGIHPANADRYEFRVIVDEKYILLPWSPITRFTDPGRTLNEFAPNYGFLGGYKTTWGHSLLVDIREKATRTIESSAIVYWRNAHPTLRAVYTTKNLGRFFAGKQQDWNWRPDSTVLGDLRRLASGNWQLQPAENTLIFIADADIYQREALEYQLIRDGAIHTAWKPNDFDNNAIFLQSLPPGNYTLELRLRAQRHNVTKYSFRVNPAWYETKLTRVLFTGLIVLALAAFVLLFILFRQRRRARREKAAREKLTLELGYIRSQLNPHFIFNALNSIQGLINRSEPDAANRYLSEFGSLLRESLAGSDQFFGPLEREIRILDTYLQLEQLRFGFGYDLSVAADVSPGSTEIPGFLLQPIVENAIKHGVAGRHETGFIRIRFFRENANFMAEVRDNGKGWEPGAKTTGYGLRLTAERIRLLNQLSDHRPVTMSISSEPGAGATVRLQFTNWWS
jgi:hypothetical protein